MALSLCLATMIGLALQAFAAPTCCWSRWGDASTCGGYTGSGHSGSCNTDWGQSCSSNGDCPDGPAPAPPSPRPTPAPPPLPPSPAPAPTPGPPCYSISESVSDDWCMTNCYSKVTVPYCPSSLCDCSPVPAPMPTPTPVPVPVPAPAPMSKGIWQGAFIQPWLSGSWNKSSFAIELSYMRQVHMNHLIWQWTVDNSPSKKYAYYPSKLPGISQTNVGDPIEASLVEGAKAGIGIWLGLANNDDWFSKYAYDNMWLQEQFGLCRDVASELWSRYGDKYGDAIAGFYIPFEIENLHFKDFYPVKRVAEALANLTNHVHALTGRSVMISPFFNTALGPPEDFAKLLGNLTAAAALDVVAVQDGVGAQHAKVDDLPLWFQASRSAIKAARPETSFWVDLETFKAGYTSADFSRVVQQLDAVTHLVDGITTFSFNHYDSPQQGHAEQFHAWSKYINGTLRLASSSILLV